MQRIDGPFAVAARPATTPAATDPGFFFGGNPAAGQKATIVTADWLNTVQEELCTVIEAAGLALDRGDSGQLLAALAKMIAAATSGQLGVPSGVIAMWSGNILAPPSGWAVCDGNNGTPDLRDRFIVGSGGKYGVKSTGGSETHSHSGSGTTGSTALTVAQIPSHAHSFTASINSNGIGDITGGSYQVGRVPAAGNTGSAGGGQGHSHSLSAMNVSESSSLPLYCALAFIMKQ